MDKGYATVGNTVVSPDQRRPVQMIHDGIKCSLAVLARTAMVHGSMAFLAVAVPSSTTRPPSSSARLPMISPSPVMWMCDMPNASRIVETPDRSGIFETQTSRMPLSRCPRSGRGRLSVPSRFPPRAGHT